MVARPTILRIDYDPAPSYFRTDLFNKIMSTVVIQDDTFKKYYQGAESVLRDLGPDAADLVWHLALERYRAKLLPHLPPSDVEDDADESAMEVERELLGSKMASTTLGGCGGAWDGGAVIESGREARKVTKAEQRRIERKKEKERIRNELREKALEELNLGLPDWLKCVEVCLLVSDGGSSSACPGSSRSTSLRSTMSASRPSCRNSSTSSRRASPAPTTSAASSSS
jgi:hypothetical protein